MQMVVEDDGAEYIVSFVWFGSETQEMSVCCCSDIMRIWWAFGMHQDMGMCLFPFRAYEIFSILHLSTKPPTSDFCVTTCWFPLSGQGFCFEYFSTWFSAGPPTSAPLQSLTCSAQLFSFATRSFYHTDCRYEDHIEDFVPSVCVQVSESRTLQTGCSVCVPLCQFAYLKGIEC